MGDLERFDRVALRCEKNIEVYGALARGLILWSSVRTAQSNKG